MKKRQLEILLSSIKNPEESSPHLEQYPTPASVAADILFTAHSLGDIEGKKVADLGCGSGIFSIGAALLGAESVIGIDIDEERTRMAEKNLDALIETPAETKKRVEFACLDVLEFSEKVDTVIMNPPFGAQRKGADRPFLKKAIESGEVVYSLHNSGTEDFIMKTVKNMSGVVSLTKNYKFTIPFMFKFHRKEKKEIDVTLFRIETGRGVR